MLTQKVQPIFAIFFPSFLIVQNREWVYWTISCYAYTMKIDWFWASFKMLNLTRVGLWLLVGHIIFKIIINLAIYTAWHMAEAIRLVSTNKGRTIRKVMGGGGKPQKNSCKGKCQEKKIHAKKRVKKKNSCRKSEFLLESLSLRNQQYYQEQYE